MTKRKTTKQSDPEFDLEMYGIDLVDTVVGEISYIISQEQINNGKEFATDMIFDILTKYINDLVIASLTPEPGYSGDPQTNYEKSLENYAQVKLRITDAIADGFASAFHQFNPNTYPEYECDVFMIDDGKDSGVTN